MENSKKNIESVKSIDTVHVFEGDIKHEPLKKVEPSEHSMVYYALHKDSGLDRIFRSVLETLTGKNAVGRTIGDIKDILSFVVPYGHSIDALTDGISDVIKKEVNTNKKRGHMNWLLDRLKEKSTWRGIFAALTALGVAVAPEVQTAVITVGIALIGLVEIIGR